MKWQGIPYIVVIISLTTAEILGPEKRRSKEKLDSDTDYDDAEVQDPSPLPSEQNAEYLKQMKIIIDEQLKGFEDRIKEVKDKIESGNTVVDEDEEPDNPLKMINDITVLNDLRAMAQKMQLKPKWFDSVLHSVDDTGKLEMTDENPMEILEMLPPLPEEEEVELTPEQKQAQELFEAAMTKLNRRTPDLQSAILEVKQAAEMGHVPAKIKLAWSYIYGEGVELNVQKAKEIFEPLADSGNADAHAGMGFLYATGIGVPVSQAKALVHYTMGALGDSTTAQMSLAYRYWSGNTVPASCPKALELYSKVAAKVASSVSISGGPGVQRTRLADEADGTSSSLDTDLIEYYQLLAEKGDVQAQIGLGQLHFQGGRGVTLDMKKALHYFQQAANAGNAVANAFLGKIYLEGGDGIKSDNDTALRYFKKAAELNNPVGQSGLGIMYLQGRGVPKDTTTAFKYFSMAANQGWVEGQLHLGFMYFGGIGVRRDFKQANKYFSLASQSGHVLAFYHLAQMHAQGLGVLRSCTTAVELFKNVCERGSWASRLMLGHAAWRATDHDSSFLQYLSLAEMGYEVAQTNAAYLLDTDEVSLFKEEERWRRALQLWSRSAMQGYSAARVKLGDYHYYGLGTPHDLEAAAHHYRIASEQQHNAQAMFNLGYMHERGLGLARDLHLAKRCYDLAADASPDARVPAALALARLNAITALDSLSESPLAVIFLTGDSLFMSNWDLYVMTLLLGALGVVVYLRRPQPPNQPQPQQPQPQQPQPPQQQQPQPQQQQPQPPQQPQPQQQQPQPPQQPQPANQ